MNICIECSKGFKPKDKRYAKFCSRSCSVSYNNRKSPKRVAKINNCPVCDKSFKGKSVYCSQSCNQKRLSREKVDDWLSGRWSGSESSGNLSRTIRAYLLEQANHQCTNCGWGEISPYISHGKPVLTINHIDGNWKNNSVDNLEVICYNCHTLTPTWGSLSTNGMSKERMGRN